MLLSSTRVRRQASLEHRVAAGRDPYRAAHRRHPHAVRVHVGHAGRAAGGEIRHVVGRAVQRDRCRPIPDLRRLLCNSRAGDGAGSGRLAEGPAGLRGVRREN